MQDVRGVPPGVGRWIAVFFHGRGGHEPIAVAGTAQEPTPLGLSSATWCSMASSSTPTRPAPAADLHA